LLFLEYLRTTMPKNVKVLIATGNQDKLNRMKKWMKGYQVEISGIKDLSVEVQNTIKFSDEKEKKHKTMDERAKAKAEYAARHLPKEYFDFHVLAMDDTAYFPLIDTYVVDLRTPKAIFDENGTLLMEGVIDRLQGIDLANHYAKILDKVISDDDMSAKMKELGYKYMPIVWRFSLAVAKTGQDVDSQTLCMWEHVQYIRNQYLTKVKDTGYVMDNIISDTPEGEVSAVRKGTWFEKEPIAVLNEYFEQV